MTDSQKQFFSEPPKEPVFMGGSASHAAAHRTFGSLKDAADYMETAASRPVEGFVMLPCPFCGRPGQIVELPHPSSPSTFNAACGTEDSEPGERCPLVFYGDRETRDEMVAKWNRRDWQGMTRQATAIGFLQGILHGLRIGIDDERAAIIDAALSDERHFAT